MASYQYRTSTDGGTTWGTPATGNPATITAEGQTLVQYRAVDAAGNSSNWFPAVPIAGSTVQIDRTAPGAPTVTGGSSSWQNVPSISFTASGSADSGGSGLSVYQYRTSTNGGTSWSGTLTGAAATVTGEGTTIVQFRVLGRRRELLRLGPGQRRPSNTAQIDRTPPTAPGATGGSLSWQSVPSVTVTPTGATDSGRASRPTSTARRPTTA